MAQEDDWYIPPLTPTDIALVKRVADEAAKSAIEGFALKMGMNPHRPLESQGIFAMLRKLAKNEEELAADFVWVRAWRQRTNGMLGKALITAMGVSVLGAAHAVWAGVQATLGSPPHH